MKIVEKKKILVLVDWFYPGYKAGGPIQSCRNFIAAMEDSFDIRVITSDRDLGDTASYPGIQVNKWNNYSAATKVFYASALSIKQLQQLQGEIAADYIYLNSMFSLRFTIYPLWLGWRNKIHTKIVLAPRGMLQQGAIRFNTQKKKLFLRLIKAAGIYKHIKFHATDVQEEKDIMYFFPGTQEVTVATNFPRMQQAPFIPALKQPGILKCIFISRIAAKKNIDYLLRLLKKLPAAITITVEIRGETEDKTYWQQCLALIAELPPSVVIQYNGPVENDAIPALLQQHHLFVLPTLGENFGHAVFEALSAGRPVLISNKTPWRQLAERKAGWDIPLDDEQAYINVLVKVANMPAAELNEWGQGAWQLAHDFITQTDIRQQYLKLFN